MKINWNFLEGGGEVQNKKPSVGVVWISGTAQCRIPHPTLLLHEKILDYTHRQEEREEGWGLKLYMYQWFLPPREFYIQILPHTN